MDGIEPSLLDRAELALEPAPGVLGVGRLQLRWVGHRLDGAATLVVAEGPLSAAETIAHEAEHRRTEVLPSKKQLKCCRERPDAGTACSWNCATIRLPRGRAGGRASRCGDGCIRQVSLPATRLAAGSLAQEGGTQRGHASQCNGEGSQSRGQAGN